MVRTCGFGSRGKGAAVALALVMTAALAETGAAQVIPDPIPRAVPARVTIGLEPVASGLTAPNWGTAAPGQPDLLFVSDQPGTVWKIDLATLARTAFLTVTASPEPGVPLIATGERGLLGLAFHPDYQQNGLLYTYTSETPTGPADFPTPLGAGTDHHSVITEWQVGDPGDPDAVVDPSSRRVLLRIGQPQSNHNGGGLAFLPDATLLIALGDGGSANDQGPGHSPGGNGQDPGNVLGAVLRLDPRGTDAVGGAYGVPTDNPNHPGGEGPFGGQAGCDADGLCDEIFADGFRNLFRLSVDRDLGTVIGGDVGQGDIEEVNVILPGRNYGWPIREGSFCLVPGSGVSSRFDCTVAGGSVFPVAQYDHDDGISVIGGFVYRGAAIPFLRGRYLFGDFFLGSRQSGRLFYSGDVVSGDVSVRWPVNEFRIAGRASLGYRLLGFGEDSRGEVYVLGGGVVEKIVRPPR